MVNLEQALGLDVYEAFMRGMARGRYQVLLGAGASATSLDRLGAPLPAGNALRDDILAEFNIPSDGSPSLKRVYQVAKARVSSTNGSIAEYLENRFSQTKPAQWYDRFLRLQWSGLWTLNIDDCVERASTALGSASRQTLKSISWTDRHSQADRRQDELLLVHLHGKATRARREGELIFDIAAYVNALTSQHRWLKVFGDEFPVAPFLVIGASLQEELELQTVFEEGRASSATEHPSIIMLRSISEFQEEEYRGYGLIPLSCTAEEFFEAVHTALPAFLNELAPQEVLKSVGAAPETFRFLTQWKALTSDVPPIKDTRHDLFRGHEPRWSDATRGLISSRNVTRPLITGLTKALEPGQHSIQVVTGEAFSGKSSLLMKACRELEGAGFTPYLFEDETAVDVDAVLHWLERVPRTVLAIDDASDFARDLVVLLADPRLAEVSLRIVLTDRLSRGGHIENELVLHDHLNLSVSSTLGSGEVDALLVLLRDKKRLGVLTQMTRSQQKQYFDDHGRKLFSAMAALEDGRGFKSRVIEEFDRVGSAESRRLLAVTGLANRLGYYVPLEVIKTASGLSAQRAEEVIEAGLSDLLVIERQRVTARHKVFGEMLIDYLDLSEKVDAIVDLALAVAPHVSPSAISASTIYYRIARTLMGHEMLLKLLDENYEAVLEVYERIEWAYEWNARFWDQRALSAADNRRFEEAFSWAQQALQRKKDSFSLNTIGAVLMRRALFEATDGRWPTETYEKAHDFLLEARHLDKEKADYPIDAFFTYTIRLLERVPVRDRGLNTQIATLWSNWYAAMLLVDDITKARLTRTQTEASSAWEKYGLESYR